MWRNWITPDDLYTSTEKTSAAAVYPPDLIHDWHLNHYLDIFQFVSQLLCRLFFWHIPIHESYRLRFMKNFSDRFGDYFFTAWFLLFYRSTLLGKTNNISFYYLPFLLLFIYFTSYVLLYILLCSMSLVLYANTIQ